MLKKLFERRRKRERYRIKKHNTAGRPRLSVFRSGRHIYAQVIDDAAGVTVASASTIETLGKLEKSWGSNAAAEVGKRVAERSLEKGVKTVVFDRGGYIYHGRVKALAEAAREGGLEF